MVDKQLVAIIVQEAGRLVTGILSLPRSKRTPVVEEKAREEPPQFEISEYEEDEKIKKGVACLPCTNSHLLTCRGLLDEAHRMSHDGLTIDGMQRVDQCLGEIAAAERVDLSPANIAQLPTEEQVVARYAAKELREIRHDLEEVKDPDVLEQAAARTTELQNHVSREYIKIRLSKMTTDERARFDERVRNNLKEDVGEVY